MAEWYLNGYAIQISVAVVFFILCNISRRIFIEGILRIFWKSLTSPLFEVTSTANIKGEIISESRLANNTKPVCGIENDGIKTDEDLAHSPFHHESDDKVVEIEEGEKSHVPIKATTQQNLEATVNMKKSLEFQLYMFKRSGYLMVVFAGLLNVPSIILFYWARQDLSYNP